MKVYYIEAIVRYLISNIRRQYSSEYRAMHSFYSTFELPEKFYELAKLKLAIEYIEEATDECTDSWLKLCRKYRDIIISIYNEYSEEDLEMLYTLNRVYN